MDFTGDNKFGDSRYPSASFFHFSGTPAEDFDNLLSNPELGNIRIEINSSGITVKNTVSEKTDTSKLKHPFIKGDKAKSGKLGSGLGLSIADAAAVRNGFRLNISCTETGFTAKIIF